MLSLLQLLFLLLPIYYIQKIREYDDCETACTRSDGPQPLATRETGDGVAYGPLVLPVDKLPNNKLIV